MAKLLPVDANTHYVSLGDGADPETFGNTCGINNLSFDTGLTKRDTPIWDCDNPVTKTENHPSITGSAYSLSLSGFLDGNGGAVWQTWYHTNDGAKRNVRYNRIGGYYEGPAVLSSFQETGNRDEDVNVSATIDFVGKPTWTAV